MKKILFAICSNRHFEKFWQSLDKLLSDCEGSYDISHMVIKDMFLPDAQNICAQRFINGEYDYLLLLDDDHWGHTKEMLNTLVEADTHVSSMKTYSRHYPYMVAAWNKVNANCNVPIENGSGYIKCDLVGFPMTLIRRDVFDLLEYPYFKAVDGDGRDWNTDISFYEELDKLGIKPIVCFQHCLNHDKITQDNVFKYRNDERMENNNIAWFNILRNKQLQGV